ncbi:hypothetical protein acsn021_42740 [Anaerocolumna cellulosilytica]|uniref:Uncharacterized protein n=1 Tax=Anaerocolumna cellulosilytica TaxID=433286 RepID=A0A6S6RCI7_9FIRM|nr:hypothetical protein [Anaerocolumna cellulosilytica]MBB5195232.1 hypothetical protein [Anaerocolumna cellulosilytica]BCJ96705.1 hypothetical protein acsn021_42740 [Anaerocolumna cellulosilytica]
MQRRKGLRTVLWLLLSLLIGLADISGLSATGAKAGSLKLQPRDSSEYVFYTDGEESINLQLIHQATAENQSPQSIEAYYNYGKDIIGFDGTEAILTSLLEQGRAQLGIKYYFKTNKIVEKPEAGIDTIGSLTMKCTDKEPYFRIINEKGSWGVGTDGVILTEEIKRLLPESIEGFTVQNYFMRNKNKYEGILTLSKAGNQAEEENTISLKELGLSKKIMEEIQQSGQVYSTLELLATYDLLLKLPFPLKGQITMKKYIQINNNK